MWRGTSSITIRTPPVTAEGKPGPSYGNPPATLLGPPARLIDINIALQFSPTSTARVQPADSAVQGLGTVAWADENRCFASTKPDDKPWVETQLLKCIPSRDEGWAIKPTLTVLDDLDAQSVANWGIFLAGVLASICAAAMFAAVEAVMDAVEARAEERTKVKAEGEQGKSDAAIAALIEAVQTGVDAAEAKAIDDNKIKAEAEQVKTELAMAPPTGRPHRAELRVRRATGLRRRRHRPG